MEVEVEVELFELWPCQHGRHGPDQIGPFVGPGPEACFTVGLGTSLSFRCGEHWDFRWCATQLLNKTRPIRET